MFGPPPNLTLPALSRARHKTEPGYSDFLMLSIYTHCPPLFLKSFGLSVEGEEREGSGILAPSESLSQQQASWIDIS